MALLAAPARPSSSWCPANAGRSWDLSCSDPGRRVLPGLDVDVLLPIRVHGEITHVMAVAPGLAVALVGAVVAGSGNGMEAVAFRTSLQEHTPQRWMALIMSLGDSLQQAVPGGGILLGGEVVTPEVVELPLQQRIVAGCASVTPAHHLREAVGVGVVGAVGQHELAHPLLKLVSPGGAAKTLLLDELVIARDCFSKLSHTLEF